MRLLVTLMAVGLVLSSCDAVPVEVEAPLVESGVQAVDAEPLAISIVSPASGATLIGQVTPQVRLTGNTSTHYSIDYFLDGDRLESDNSSTQFTFNANSVAAGFRTLTAQFRNSAGATATSQAVGVMVEHDFIPPTVSIVSPASGATFSETMSVQGVAADNHDIYMVRAHLDGTLLNIRFGKPYDFEALSIRHFSNGPHTLTLEAFDRAMNRTVSEPVTVILDSDKTPPTVSLVEPAGPVTVPGGKLMMRAEAADDRQLAKVVFLLDGYWVGEATAPPFTAEWESGSRTSGDYTLVARAYDAAGNVSTTAAVPVKIHHPGTAVYDEVMGVPVCDTVMARCDTAKLLEGRNRSEVHAPNTLDGCVDGPGLDIEYTERVQRLTVSRVGGEFLAEHRRAKVSMVVVGDALAINWVDLFSASDATNPVWTYVTTVRPAIYGAHVLSAEFVLPEGSLQAVRAQFRVGSASSSSTACTAGSRDDHDDLVFAVGQPTDAFPPVVRLTQPYSGLKARGIIPVAAEAEDDMAVTRVEFFADGVLVGTDSEAPYAMGWDSATVADGTHVLTARAYDPAGRATTSGSMQVTTDNTPPRAQLVAPAPGLRVRGVVLVESTASDANGIQRVDYFSGGEPLRSYSPWPGTYLQYRWYTNTVADGPHLLTARATDSLGNVGVSPGVEVIVDNTGPSSDITAPQAYAALRGVVEVSADASDPAGVERVELYANGTLVATDATAPYALQWDTAAGPDGNISLKTVAYDTLGNNDSTRQWSHPVTVDNTGPTVAITSPANGASLLLATTVQASASDTSGVTQVVFYDGTRVIGTDTTSPYSVSWNLLGVTKGSHTLTAQARDALGNVRTSAPITVKVN
jgi:hypothetical protein